jgi:hypothetical protein
MPDANGPAHPIRRLSGSKSLLQWAANRDGDLLTRDNGSAG